MTNMEARNIIDDISWVYKGTYITEQMRNECRELCSKALEKQIPKKIIKLKHHNYSSPYICPICEADQIPTEFFTIEGGEPKEKHTHCWKCGQKLDWSKEE